MRRIGNPPGNGSVSPAVPDIRAVPLWLGLWPRGTGAGRVVAGIVVIAVLVAACGANVGESTDVAESAAAVNGGPIVDRAPRVRSPSVAPVAVPPQPPPPPGEPPGWQPLNILVTKDDVNGVSCIRIPNNIIETIARTAPLGTAVSVVA